MTTKTFSVLGMKCGVCKASVERALCSLDGVESAVAHLETASVEVSYDEAKVTPQALADAVDEAGFGLEF